MDILGTMELVNLVDLHRGHGREISTGGTTVTSFNFFKKGWLQMKHPQKGPRSWSQDSPFFPSLWVGSTRWFSLKVQMRSLKRGRAPALVHKSFYYIRSVFEGNPECKHTMWKDNNGEEAPRINWRQLATLNKFSPPFPHSPTNSSHFVCFVCLLDFWSFPRRRQSKMPF